MLSLDAVRLRLRVPLTCTIAELEKFVCEPGTRAMLHWMRRQVRAFDELEEHYVALSEAICQRFAVSGIVIDSGKFYCCYCYEFSNIKRARDRKKPVSFSYVPICRINKQYWGAVATNC